MDKETRFCKDCTKVTNKNIFNLFTDLKCKDYENNGWWISPHGPRLDNTTGKIKKEKRHISKLHNC